MNSDERLPAFLAIGLIVAWLSYLAVDMIGGSITSILAAIVVGIIFRKPFLGIRWLLGKVPFCVRGVEVDEDGTESALPWYRYDSWYVGYPFGADWIASLTLWIFLLSCVVAPVYFLGDFIVNKGIGYVQDFMHQHGSFQEAFLSIVNQATAVLPEGAANYAQEQATTLTAGAAVMTGKFSGMAVTTGSTFVTRVMDFLGGFGIFMLISFFIHTDGPKALRWIEEYLHLGDRGRKMFKNFEGLVIGIVLGTLMVAWGQAALYSGILYLITMSFDFPYWGILTVIMVVGAIIPAVPTLAMIVATVILFGTGHPIAGMLAIGSIGILGSADNVVRGWIISKQVDIKTSVVILSTVFGLINYGFMGIVIGPGVWASLIFGYSLLNEIINHFYSKDGSENKKGGEMEVHLEFGKDVKNG